VFWLIDTSFLWVIIAATLMTMVVVRIRNIPLRALLVADALGLALFAISGARIAETAGYGGIVAVILGTMSGVAGGVLRDGEIYATAALLGIIVYLGLQVAGLERTTAAYFGMAVIAALRFTGIFLGLRMPALRLGESQDKKQG